MNFIEDFYLKRTKYYKKQYLITPWYMFKRKIYLYNKWRKSFNRMMKNSKLK